MRLQNLFQDEFETTIPAQDGNSLILTINGSIQHTLEKGLQDILEEYSPKRCLYGVVMDVKPELYLQWLHFLIMTVIIPELLFTINILRISRKKRIPIKSGA